MEVSDVGGSKKRSSLARMDSFPLMKLAFLNARRSEGRGRLADEHVPKC